METVRVAHIPLSAGTVAPTMPPARLESALMSEADVRGLRDRATRWSARAPRSCCCTAGAAASRAWRPIREALRADHTVVSVDLPGLRRERDAARGVGERRVRPLRGRAAGAARRDGSVRARSGTRSAARSPSTSRCSGDVPLRSLMLVGTPGVRLPLSEETKRRIARVKRGEDASRRWLPGPMRRAIEGALARLGSEDYRNAGAMRPILVETVNEDMSELAARYRACRRCSCSARNDTATPPEIGRRDGGGDPGQRPRRARALGHFPYLDEPAAFNAVARSFLGSIEGAAR